MEDFSNVGVSCIFMHDLSCFPQITIAITTSNILLCYENTLCDQCICTFILVQCSDLEKTNILPYSVDMAGQSLRHNPIYHVLYLCGPWLSRKFSPDPYWCRRFTLSLSQLTPLVTHQGCWHIGNPCKVLTLKRLSHFPETKFQIPSVLTTFVMKLVC